jgi:hypothetical protein
MHEYIVRTCNVRYRSLFQISEAVGRCYPKYKCQAGSHYRNAKTLLGSSDVGTEPRLYHNSADDICVQKMCMTVYRYQISLLARRDTVLQHYPYSHHDFRSSRGECIVLANFSSHSVRARVHGRKGRLYISKPKQGASSLV